MYQNRDTGFVERAINLLKTGDGEPSLIGQSQGIADPAQDHGVEPDCEFPVNRHGRLETSIKNLCFYCFFYSFPMGG